MGEAVQGVVLAPVIFEITRLSCDPGETFDDVVLVCKTCLFTEYVVDPDQSTCIACPVGGACDGSTVRGKDGTESLWQVCSNCPFERTAEPETLDREP